MLRSFLFFALSTLLVACSTPEPRLGPDGQPLAKVYRLSDRNAAEVQFRMLEGINTLRQARGAQPVEISAELTAAAKTHSRDMSVQNRPWHFGSDGSNPIERASRAGYTGRLLGENISETFETELETLGAWMETVETREVILDKRARDMGFSWFQEPNGKIWWTLLIGQAGGGAPGGV